MLVSNRKANIYYFKNLGSQSGNPNNRWQNGEYKSTINSDTSQIRPLVGEIDL